jgi:hypothetical protein
LSNFNWSLALKKGPDDEAQEAFRRAAVGYGGWIGGLQWNRPALHALIAEVRGATAALAEAEQKVASFTAELAQQDQIAHPVTKPVQQTPRLISKRSSSVWVAAGY